MKQVDYSIVIPVYNSHSSITMLVNRIAAVFDKTSLSFEVILVDDGSQNQEVWKNILILSAKFKWVIGIRFTRNFGQQSATICGIRYSQGQFVITMDDDLQHLPEEIPKLIEAQSHDVVIAQFGLKNHRLSKRILSRVKGYFDELILGKPRELHLTSFRLIRRPIVEAMKPLFDTPYPFLPAMFFYVTKDVVGVRVTHASRFDGKTGYTISKMVSMFSNLVINNSSLLLKVIGNVGLTISTLAFCASIYLVARKIIVGVSVVGWTSVIVSILFIGGLLLVSVGIIGEYLIRIIRGVDRHPNYIVRDSTANDIRMPRNGQDSV